MLLTRAVALLGLLASSFNAQFTCTLTNKDEASCLNGKDDDGVHCVWCGVAGFGFCVGEDQAEKMEANLPIQCDRYSGGNDDTPHPTDDGVAPPSDDALPHDFWTCLEKVDSKSCVSSNCTWCNSNKFGFGLCMTGPAAESASDSDFFTCTAPSVVKDPMDTACLLAFLQDPTQEGCTAAADSEGKSCEWCSLAGMTNLCLTEEQAEKGSPFGVSCQEHDDGFFTSLLRGAKKSLSTRDPFDTACVLAFLQSPTEETCEAATDSDGNPCEFCVFQGQYQICLTQEQAMYGQQIGLECSTREDLLLDFLTDEDTVKEDVKGSPYDTSCFLAFLPNPTEEGCKSAMDQDGKQCEYCSLQGKVNICLTHDQAEMGESVGLECGSDGFSKVQTDPLDPSCIMAFAKANGVISPEDCTATMDSDGAACEFCSIPGVTDSLCLTTTQAETAMKFVGGLVQCGGQKPDVDLPPDFFTCLKEYQEGDCNGATGCTWCSSQVGIGFCMADAAARALSECNFFTCDKTSFNQELGLIDSSLIAAE